MTAPALSDGDDFPLPRNVIEACENPDFFAAWFREPATWAAWLVFLKVFFALPLDPRELTLFRECTGRDGPPTDETREAYLIVGRRGGKSLILALIAVYLAVLIDWSPYLTPGERGTIMIIAADRKQARTIFRYVAAMVKHLDGGEGGRLIERETAEQIDLANGVTIEILTANFRTVRGYSLIAGLADEVAFWRSEESGANPDTEILAAIRPAMATIPRSRLLVASSPYARRGVLWDAYRRHYAKDGDVLVWKADTRTMNPTVPQSIIDEAIEADPASAAAEYGAEFRSDVETFVSREAIEACTVHGRYELPPAEGVQYVAFCDPSGGSGADSFTVACCHMDPYNDVVVLDALRAVSPNFNPDSVVAEFCALLKTYRIATVHGDRWGGEWPRERFRLYGVAYQPSSRTKSDLYIALLPILNSGKIELLDHARLQSQLAGLERRTARGGKDSIDHAPGAHDDICNSVAGAAVMCRERSSTGITFAAISVPTLGGTPRRDYCDDWLR